MIRAAILPTKTTLPCDKTRLQLTYGIFSPHIRNENAPWAELNWDGEIIARTVREGGRTRLYFSGCQTDSLSTSPWNSSLTPRQQWPVMCGFNCNKTVKFVRSPHVKWGWSAHEIWRPFFSQSYRAGCAFRSCISAELFTLTPRIPTATRFPLRAHHLLTHRLTSLTLQHEGVAASMNRWLRGKCSVCVCVWEREREILIQN